MATHLVMGDPHCTPKATKQAMIDFCGQVD
jgi:hypothetical protein